MSTGANGDPAKSILGLTEERWIDGAISPCLSWRSTFVSPAIPAAPSRCPMFALTEPITQLPGSAPANARFSAATSIGSPRLVPVPCASR